MLTLDGIPPDRLGRRSRYRAGMVPAGLPHGGLAEAEAQLRHTTVPTRTLGTRIIIARSPDGAPLALAVIASIVWRQLDDWSTPTEIDRRLAEAFPDVAEQDRMNARAEILGMLQGEDLIERR